MTNITPRSCLLLLAMLMMVSVSSLSEKTGDSGNSSAPSVYSVHYIDPDIIDSEWNHHVAGYFLIASAILYVIGLSVSPLSWARSSWIILLIAAAVFLAVWSDKEIWPRGTLNWVWLLHHDAEARQHKIYAILLFVIALVEYLRQSGKLSRLWGIWAFPTLAVLGAFFLLMHSHDGHSGLPPGWDEPDKHAQLLKMAGVDAMPLPTDNTQGDLAPKHHGNSSEMPPMPMPQLQQGTAGSMQAGHSDRSEHHHHGGALAHVEEQHLWFAVVGIALAVFKWADDGQLWRNKYATYLWPCSMITLGVLLALYTEIK